jgi:RHS repeat-associated protein
MAYDAEGNVTETVDRIGRRTTMIYDALNRLEEAHYADATVTYNYDAASRLESITDPSGTIAWTYFDNNLVKDETTTDGVVAWEYNVADQLKKMTLTPTGPAPRQPVDYGFDDFGRLETITQGSEVFGYSYDALSRLETLTRPNGVTTTYEYDIVHRLKRIWHKDALGATIEDFGYEYTPDDEIATVTSLHSQPPLPPAATASAADDANRIAQFGSTSYTFNDEGETVARAEGENTTNLTWDARGRLTQAMTASGTVTYTYDAIGRRTSRMAGQSATNFLYDGADVVLDYGSTQVDYLNGPGIDNKLRQISSTGGALYFLGDHLGSTTALTNLAGGVDERFEYEPFGASAGTVRTRYGFAGRERDENTGLIYNRARWLDPKQGRFLTEDPIGFDGGLNLYAYVGNDPTNHSDPLGLIDPDSPDYGPEPMYGRPGPPLTEEDWQRFYEDTAGAVDVVQTGLDVAAASETPVFSQAAGIGSGAIDVCRGDWEGVGLSAAGLTPGVGNIADAGKITRRAARLAKLLKRPLQLHHYATNKSKKYSKAMARVAKRYGLSLDDAWNKEYLPHQGRHPGAYHRWVLREMQRAAQEAGDDACEFLRLFDKYVKEPVRKNPDLLRRAGWE